MILTYKTMNYNFSMKKILFSYLRLNLCIYHSKIKYLYSIFILSHSSW